MHLLLCFLVLSSLSGGMIYGLVSSTHFIRSTKETHLSASRVALTREKGTNDKLKNLLTGVECFEIPCIMFESTPDRLRLREEMKRNEVIVITSPQSASVFIEEWDLAGKPPVKIVAIGKGTSKPLHTVGIKTSFEPDDSTAESLAKELPRSIGDTLLYPCSALADNTLPDALTAKGFKVTRLNSYTTVPASWTEADYSLANSVDIVTFASPSTIKVWKERIGIDKTAVTIGITSYNAALKAGFKDVHYPPGSSKGLEPWAQMILEVAKNLEQRS